MAGPPSPIAAVRLAVRSSLETLPPGSRVLVACSGGADSLALAAATAFVAPRLGMRAGAVIVDHGLQEGSADQAAATADVLRRLGLDPAQVVRVTVGSEGGPEAAARLARYDALHTAATTHSARAVLLAHSLDDQAETVLLRLGRGSGARSLAGMPAVWSPPEGPTDLWRRPVLKLRRAVLREFCTASGLEPWDDPHNSDRTYARVRVRLLALPALEAALGPPVVEALARTADQLRDDADALDVWTAHAYAQAAQPPDNEGTPASLAIEPVLGLPPAVRRRVVRHWAVTGGARPGSLGSRHVEALDALLVDWHGQGGVALPGGLTAQRDYGRLTLSATDATATGEDVGGR